MKPKKIMIVEDNDLNLKLFTDLLVAQGYTVVSTMNGNEGYGLAEREVPDLILMDIQLPEISGLEITRQIKANTALSHIPVIAVTAFAMKGDEQKIRDGGCQAYIAKPVSINHFLTTIRQFLDSE